LNVDSVLDDVTSGGRGFHVPDAATGKEDHQLSGGMSKEWRRPVTMLSEDDVGRVDQ